MAITYELESPEKGKLNVQIRDEREYTFNYPCQSLFYCTPYVVSFSPGYYVLETWGAQGGSYRDGNGGKGGYSKGKIFFKQITKGYLYIGGQGTASRTNGEQNGGYNGGGYGQYNDQKPYGAGGGGGTDIRLLSNTLYHRVIVSGGGGGSGFGHSYSVSYADIVQNGFNSHNAGGYGGGDKGADSTYNPYFVQYRSYGGTQTNPGSYVHGTIAAQFGLGGSSFKYDRESCAAPGGGGGWYGGGAPGGMGFGAAGGSGYLLTENSYKPKGYKLSSDFYLTNTSRLSGVRIGNGMIKITVIKLTGGPIKKCNFFCSHYFIMNPILSHALSIVTFFDFS